MTVSPPEGVEYPQVLRGPSHAWWRSLLGVVLALTALLFLTPLVNQTLVTVTWVLSGNPDQEAYGRDAYAFHLPGGMLAAGLAIASLAPVSWLLVTALHHVRPCWLSSVQPGLRWRYVLICLTIALTVFPAALWLTTLVKPHAPWVLRPEAGAFLGVILLTTPLQAAAEEIFFRGYLLQAFGSLVRGPWVAISLSALVFAVLHGGQNPAMFVDRFALGAVAGVLVWRTGGLEAAIAAHVVSNMLTYLNAALTSSAATVRATQHITWLDAVSDVGVLAVFTLAAILLARRENLQRRVHLDRPRPVVPIS